MFDKSSGLSIYNKIKRNSRLAIELALCSQRDDLQGIYLSPSFTNPQTWFGLIYVRYGVYSRASYRFIIIMGNDQYDPSTMKFPINHEKQSATKSSSGSSASQNHENTHSYWRLPRIFFYGPTKPYHPHIHPTTGELNLGWYFKEWDEKRHHIWHCLKCLKHLFYSKLGKSDLNVEVGTLDNQNLQNPQNPQNPHNLQNLAESKINSHRIPMPIAEIKSQNTLLESHNQQQKPLAKMPSNSSENSSASNTSHNNPHNLNGISRNYSTTSSGTSNTNSNTNPPHHTSNTHHHHHLHLPHLHPQTQNSKTLFNETAATVYQTNHEEFKQAVQFNIERTRNELDTIPVVTDDLFEPNYSTLESDNIYLVAKNKMKIAGEKHKLTGWQAQNAQTSGHSFVMPGTIRPFSKR